MDDTLFIYYKDGQIKALRLSDAKIWHDFHTVNGWKHTATINPSAWIQSLYESDDKELFIKRLTEE